MVAKNDVTHKMTQICESVKLIENDVGGAAEGDDGLMGTGTDPNTFAPIEFVVFSTVELVLQI